VGQPEDDDLARLVSEAFDHGLPPIPAHLIDAARSLRPRPAEEPVDGLAARRARRVDRHLAAAASSGARGLAATLRSTDGSILTEVSESDEGRLLVTVRSADPTVLYVELAWTPVAASGPGRRSRLVTPLAPDRNGVSVCYDLGPIDRAEAVDVEPAEPLPVTRVEPGDVALGLALMPTGASQRAWARAREIHRANGDPLADTIERGLQG